MITSNQNPKMKLARALLGRPKERRESEAFVAEGVRLVEEALRAEWPIRYVLHTAGSGERGRALIETLKERQVEVEETLPSLLEALSDTGNTQGVLAVVEQVRLPLPQEPTFLLIADQVRDPGNLGTLLRTAAAAGVDATLLATETTDVFAPKVVRAGMGAHFHMPMGVMDWDEIERVIQGMEVLLADMEGRPCWETDLSQRVALIVGGEAEGASEAARRAAKGRICIPMPGQSESLNAGVAGAILMFEVVRQRTSRK